jgi:transcription elongation factor Elf1
MIQDNYKTWNNSDKAEKWINAGKMLAINPDSSVKCPECGISNLKSMDINFENNLEEFSRLIYCENCGTKNYLRMHKVSQGK